LFKRVLAYAGEYRKTTYAAVAAMLAGMVMQVLPFWFIYQIIRPVLMREEMTAGYVALRVAAIAACTVLYAVLYIWGLALSHNAAYNTLKNLRISLQRKLEALPLGVIQEKGVGAIKKMFIDDIETIELPLAHAIGSTPFKTPIRFWSSRTAASRSVEPMRSSCKRTASIGNLWRPAKTAADGAERRNRRETADPSMRFARRIFARDAARGVFALGQASGESCANGHAFHSSHHTLIQVQGVAALETSGAAVFFHWETRQRRHLPLA